MPAPRRPRTTPIRTKVVGLALVGMSPLLMPVEVAPSTPTAQPSQHPNIVVIMLDDARLDDLDYMPKTQRRLVSAGAEFTNFYAPTPLCCPARAAFLSGQYGHNNAVLSNQARYGGFASFDDQSTLATWLDPTYATAWIGKYFNGYADSADDSYIPPGWDRWAAPIRGTWEYKNHTLNVDGALRSYRGVYSTDVYWRQTRRFIQERASGSEPFFVVTSYLAPHTGVPRELDDPETLGTPNVELEYRDTYVGPSPSESPAYNEVDMADKRPSVRNNVLLADEQTAAIAELNAQRRESLRSVDDKVAATLRVLREAGELDNTFVILASDNGYLLGEHRIPVGKHHPYEPSNHIPLVVRGPGIQPRVVDGLIGMHDLAPTILQLADLWGQQGDFPIDGKDFSRMLAGARPQHEKRSIVLEISDNQGGYRYHGIVRQDGWKYIEFTTDGVNEVEMYDLSADPYELHNLSDDPHYADVRAELDATLRRLMYCAADTCE